MEVLGIFRRGAIGNTDALAEFLEQQATELARKVVEQYTRARAGAAAESLFAEAAFAPALARAQSEAYPLFLAMLAEMVEGVLRPQAPREEAALLHALQALILDVFERHGVPDALTVNGWAALRTDLARALVDVQQKPPKAAADIADPFAPSVLAVMPIHDLLRRENFPALRNDLRTAIAHAYDDFGRRVRARPLVAILLGRR